MRRDLGSRLAWALAFALLFNLGLAAFLAVVNERIPDHDPPQMRLQSVGLIDIPDAEPPEPLKPETPPPPEAPPPEEPAPGEAPEPSYAPPSPQVRAPRGSTLDIGGEVAIQDGLRALPLPVKAPQVSSIIAKPQGIPDIFETWQVDTKPGIVSRVEPTYPRRAMRRNVEQGKAVLRFVIGIDGKADRAEVVAVEPAGFGFEQSAMSALRRWRFTPARFQGRAVPCWARQVFRFNLEG